MSQRPRLLERLIDAALAWRGLCLGAMVLLTVFLSVEAFRVKVEAPHEKFIPARHPYVMNYARYGETFGRTNAVAFALMPKTGTIFDPGFLRQLEEATQEIFLMPGIDRASVRSLFSPAVRTMELVEGGIMAQNVIPSGFSGTKAEIEQVRRNVKSSPDGRLLTARDMNGALILATLLDVLPETGRAPDGLAVGRDLEKLRRKLEEHGVNVHIIGFPSLVREIAEGLLFILIFFFIAVVLSAFFVWGQIPSWKVTGVVLGAAGLPVLWLLGLLRFMGFGIDPLSVLVPFLIFSIGLTHATQVGLAWTDTRRQGITAREAARAAFLATAAPGAAALVSDAFGFFVLLYIGVPVVTQIGWAAGVGIVLMIVSHLFFLPLLLSMLGSTQVGNPAGERYLDRMWTVFAAFTRPRLAWPMVVLTLALASVAWNLGRRVEIGDAGEGAPELRDSTRYNRDWRAIASHFSIGLDYMTVYVQGTRNLDVDADAMERIERFAAQMSEVPGVSVAMAITDAVKAISVLQNDGSLKWRALPTDSRVLGAYVGIVPPEFRFMNSGGDAYQISLYLKGHDGPLLRRVTAEAEAAAKSLSTDDMKILLAGGPAGMQAATNDAVAKARSKVHLTIWAIVIISCLTAFRSIRAAICVSLPLQLSSMLSSALMALLGIGIKLATLPVVSLGVGVGEDYAIYLYHAFAEARKKGLSVEKAFRESLRQRGRAVVATGATMGFGLILWTFSPVKYQADLGLLLGFLFLANMLASLVLLPALVSIFMGRGRKKEI